jgi:hypothetical protein
MNLLSLLIAPVQAVVLFFAPHAGTIKPSGMRMPVRAHASALPGCVPRASCASAASNGGFVHAGRTTTPRSKPSVSAKPIHRVRIVRNVDASLPADRAGRMVVSGRFADVCAELDKLASMEMQTA